MTDVATGTEDVEIPAAEAPEAGPARSPLPPAWTRGALGLGMVAAATWLLLRPGSPQGVAAVVDLLVLPAVLLAEVRLLAGPTSLPARTLLALFGVGAVVCTVATVVVEGAVWGVLGSSALHRAGPFVEVAAVCAPVLFLVALSPAGRRLGPADLAVAGLVTGLGFLVVQASLVTAVRHAGPEYVSPLVAGWLRVPRTVADPSVHMGGAAVAAALVGLAVGLALRFRRAYGLPAAGLALALVAVERSLFDDRLRRFADSEAAPSGPADALLGLTFDGRLSLVLLAAGLLVARRLGPARPSETGRRRPATSPDVTQPAAEEPSEEQPLSSSEPGADREDDARLQHLADELVERLAPPDAGPGEAEADLEAAREAVPRPTHPVVVAILAAGVIGTGVLMTVLARTRHLGGLDKRPLALAVSGAGLAYGLWSAAGWRAQPRPAPGEEAHAHVRWAGARLLSLGAVASSALGVVCALLPGPDTIQPFHGGLFLDAVRGWGASVGSVGLLLGLGGLAAPGGGLALRSQAWFVALLPPRFRPGGRSGGEGWVGVGVGGAGRRRRWWSLRRRAPGGQPDHRRRWSRTGLRWTRVRPAIVPGAGAGDAVSSEGPTILVTIEAAHRPSLSRGEYQGATVKEAIMVALRQSGVDFAHAALQLVDAGGPGRPARVRVAEAREEEGEVLLPPGRDSILRATPVVVVVEVPVAPDHEPPPTVAVTLRVSSHRTGVRDLECRLHETASVAARYRSNAYLVDEGEQVVTASPTESAPAAAVRIRNGEQLIAEHEDASAAVTVYDGWKEQVLGVNAGLIRLTREAHQGTIEELETLQAEMEPAGDTDPRVGDRIRQLRTRLSYLAEAEELSEPALDVRAFLTTALLHAAMNLEHRYDDPAALEQSVRRPAREALERCRREGASDPTGSAMPDAYRDFLEETVVGELWTAGAATLAAIGTRLGWDRFDDPRSEGGTG